MSSTADPEVLLLASRFQDDGVSAHYAPIAPEPTDKRRLATVTEI